MSTAVSEVTRWECTDEEYYADTSHASCSMLKVYHKSPRLYQGMYVTGEWPPLDPTEAMDRGTALHCLCLEPEKFPSRFVVGGPINPKTGKSYGFDTQAFQNWKATISQEVLSETMAGKCRAMARALQQHVIAGPLLTAEGETEIALRWSDMESGLDCRCKLDKLVLSSEWGCKIILDLKTAAEPGPDHFPRQAHNLLYHVQSSMYTEAAEAWIGERPMFVFAVVGSDIPHDVWVYVMDDDFAEHGRRALADLRGRLAASIGFNSWEGDGQSQIQLMKAPGWAKLREV